MEAKEKARELVENALEALSVSGFHRSVLEEEGVLGELVDATAVRIEHCPEDKQRELWFHVRCDIQERLGEFHGRWHEYR